MIANLWSEVGLAVWNLQNVLVICAPSYVSRGRRSPRGRQAQPGPGSLPDTDRDRLLTDHSATYRKYPGLNNVAYMVNSLQASMAKNPAVS